MYSMLDVGFQDLIDCSIEYFDLKWNERQVSNAIVDTQKAAAHLDLIENICKIVFIYPSGCCSTFG